MHSHNSEAPVGPCPVCGKRTLHSDRQLLEQRIAELEIENARLRISAKAFGELAERLNEQLREERRSGDERRLEPRAALDRRDFRAE